MNTFDWILSGVIGAGLLLWLLVWLYVNGDHH